MADSDTFFKSEIFSAAFPGGSRQENVHKTPFTGNLKLDAGTSFKSDNNGLSLNKPPFTGNIELEAGTSFKSDNNGLSLNKPPFTSNIKLEAGTSFKSDNNGLSSPFMGNIKIEPGTSFKSDNNGLSLNKPHFPSNLKLEAGTSFKSDNNDVANGSGMQNPNVRPAIKSVYYHAKFGPAEFFDISIVEDFIKNHGLEDFVPNDNVVNSVGPEESLPNVNVVDNIQNDRGPIKEAGSICHIESDSEDSIIDLEEFEGDKAMEKFYILEEMFPDADTIFLKAKCAEYALNTAAFEFFIDALMIPGDYPRKQPQVENPEEINNNDEGENKFDLQAFLKKYPQPANHFSRNFKTLRNIQHHLNYLQLRHVYLSASMIRNVFCSQNCNLYLTDLILRKKPKTRKNPRRPKELTRAYGKPPPEFFEVTKFLDHEEEIMQFIHDRDLARANAVEEARRVNALLVCGCCYTDELLAEEVSQCMEGHIFCKECILRSCEVNLGDGKIDFPCLQECSSFFEIKTLKDILPEAAFVKLERKLQEREVASANIIGLENCPFCEFAAIPPEETRIFDCANCKKQSCRLCKKESHIPYSCSEMQNNIIQSRIYVEERMTEALLRTCYKCNAKFIREDGCNKMVCVCGAMMCYICRQPIRNYSHFYERNSTKPINGKCPLWTNNTNIHQEEVNREREVAIEFQKRKNPNLDESIFKKHKV